MEARPTDRREQRKRLACTTCDASPEWGWLGPCPSCGGILECVYPQETLRCLRAAPTGGLCAYRDRLPIDSALCSLGEGDTPLLQAHNVGSDLGLPQLYLKNETVNPTGSFKDRGAAVALTRAVALGARGILTASTGNAAAALAAYSATQRMPCLVLASSASPLSKLRQALAYGAKCLPVEGLFDGEPEAFIALLTELSARLRLELAFFWAPVSPYPLEAMKTIAYETVAQLQGQVPDVVVCPVGGGDGLVGQWRGYLELQQAGVIDCLPRMIGVQSDGAAPLVLSYERGLDRVMHVPEAHTVASGLQVTFSGDHALHAVRASGGSAVSVPDEDILAFQRRLARQEGLWAEPSGAIGVAALPSLLRDGLVDPAERIVCVVTGAGFKDHHHDATSEADDETAMAPVPFDLATIEAHSTTLLQTARGERIT